MMRSHTGQTATPRRAWPRTTWSTTKTRGAVVPSARDAREGERGEADVEGRQGRLRRPRRQEVPERPRGLRVGVPGDRQQNCGHVHVCLLYTSDAADDLLCVDLGG